MRHTTRPFLFVSQGRIGLVNDDGSGLRYLNLDAAAQESWAVGPCFADGQRMLLTSWASGPGRAWKGEVETNRWVYDFAHHTLTPIVTTHRLAAHIHPSLLVDGDRRMVAAVMIDGESRLFTMNLDGSDPIAISQPGQGFHYPPTRSPDGARIAFHATAPGVGYQVFTARLDGSDRTLVAGQAGHLYFGYQWSPDGAWLVYLDCHYASDPGHDWADLCIGRADGSEHRVITEGQRYWFAAAHGDPARPASRGSGSNVPTWSPDGATVTYTRAAPGSAPAWRWAAHRPDVDHFNREFDGTAARGGTEICLLNPFTGHLRPLLPYAPGRWDWNALWSPDGRCLVFNRATVGGVAELWAVDADGRHPRLLTRGLDALGAHPRCYLPSPAGGVTGSVKVAETPLTRTV